jgi:hypothetical protein
MNRSFLVLMTVCSLTASRAMADDFTTARDMARKDYEATLATIRANDAATSDKCRTKIGPAAQACLIQARGKRLRAEQEAKARLDRLGAIAPLPDAQANIASHEAPGSADNERRPTTKDVDAEANAAVAECRKAAGAVRKTCEAEVAQRRQEAFDVADALYKKSRSDAKTIKAP